MTIERICSSCFGDADLRRWIRSANGPRGCDACGKFDSPTMSFDEVVERIEDSLGRYYGRAVEQLPYQTAEGGYLGRHWDAWDMLEMIDFSLPRDDGNLFTAIASSMQDEPWCEYDWLSLDTDVALSSSWQQFCHTVKHRRRFFFHSTGTDDHDSYTPNSLLNQIARISEHMGLIKELPVGTELWRARTDLPMRGKTTIADFGPPPVEHALQSNRMNPPGIPLLYLASTPLTALKEVRASEAKVGLLKVNRPLRFLDLRQLPQIPGMFSDADREFVLSLKFLHDFSDDIMTPVPRDKRMHIDYLPSQVVTEFIRDYEFTGGKVDGIAYGSTLHSRGWNVALFLGPLELGITAPSWGAAPPPYLTLVRTKWHREI